MKSFIRNLSPPAEFCLVVFVTFLVGFDEQCRCDCQPAEWFHFANND
jgi:hypothetical protein